MTFYGNPSILVAAAILLCVAVAPSQGASYAFFGAAAPVGCQGTTTVGHAPVGLPFLGAQFAIDVPMSTGAGGTTCGSACDERVLLLGLSTQNFQGVPLPLDLSVYFGSPLYCGSLLVSIDVAVAIPFGPGVHRYSLPIPALLPLVGFEVHQQVATVRRVAGSPDIVAMGIGGTARIGFGNISGG